MSNSDAKDEMTALVVRSAHDLVTRSSLVVRGLRDISNGFQTESADILLERVTALVQQDRFEEASAVCTIALEMYPQDECLLLTNAVCLAKQGKYDQGLPFLLHALELGQENHHSWVIAARFYNHLGNLAQEVSCWKHVVALEPNYKGAWKGMGDCLFTLGRQLEAMEAFNSELKLCPSDDYCLSRRDGAIAALLGEERDEWTPTSILSPMGWYSDKFDGRQLAPYTEIRHLSLFCQIFNLSDHKLFIGKQLSMYRRSKHSREMKWFADALVLELTLPLRIAPHSEIDLISVEVTWTCPLEKTDPDCIEELFDTSWETVGRDDEFGTVIKFME